MAGQPQDLSARLQARHTSHRTYESNLSHCNSSSYQPSKPVNKDPIHPPNNPLIRRSHMSLARLLQATSSAPDSPNSFLGSSGSGIGCCSVLLPRIHEEPGDLDLIRGTKSHINIRILQRESFLIGPVTCFCFCGGL